jgi:hypothetical protein
MANSKDDDLFSGRGSPAFMSPKEPAIRLLKERYSESFAFTGGSRENQVHLFLIKLGLWSLVLTLTPRDLKYIKPDVRDIEMPDALRVIEDALSGKNPIVAERLDESVKKSLERIKKKLQEFKR